MQLPHEQAVAHRIQEIDKAVDVLEGLTSQLVEPAEYWPQMARLLAQATAAERTEIYLFTDNQLVSVARIPESTVPAANPSELTDALQRAVQTMLAQQTIFPQSAHSSSRWHYFVEPIAGESSVAAVAAVAFPDPMSEAVASGARHILESFAVLGRQYLASRSLQQLRERDDFWQRLDAFQDALQASVVNGRTQFVIANRTRDLLGCDRVALLERHGSRSRLKAVSGVEQIDRRSLNVRRLEDLVQVVTAAGGGLWWHEAAEDLPPEVDLAVQRYVEVAHCRSFAVLPLQVCERVATADEEAAPQTTVGSLVLENFSAALTDNIHWQTDLLLPKLATALRSARVQQSWGVRWLVRPALQTQAMLSARYRFRQLLLLVVAVGLVGILVGWRVPMTVSVEGELRLVERRNLFAPMDATVANVRVAHAAEVRQGDELIQLQSQELLRQIHELEGNVRTLQERLLGVASERFTADRNRASDPSQPTRWSANEREIKQQIANHQLQLAAYESQRSSLKLVSPIDGQVLDWDVASLLVDRPVQRGQLLLSVANVNGEWVLELKPPEYELGYIQAASQEQSSPLVVSFLLATDSSQEYQGVVDTISSSAFVDDDGRAYAIVTVRLDHPPRSA